MLSITPHVCRHTYCSIMAKSGMNPKTLKCLVGHSDTGITVAEQITRDVQKRLVIFAKKPIENFVIFFGQTLRLKTVIDMTGDKYKPK